MCDPILVLVYPTETLPALKERAGDRPSIKIRTSNSQASPAGETRTGTFTHQILTEIDYEN